MLLSADKVSGEASFLSDAQIDALDFSGLAPAHALEEDEPITRAEGFWNSFDDVHLFWQSWAPEGGPTRGVIALMHGFGEHSARYEHVAGALCRAGYAVMAIDARGHGRSGGKRAHVKSFSDYVRDYELLIMHARAQWPAQKLFSFGHSNGGLIVLSYALTQPKDVSGFVVSSPACKLAVKVNPIKAAAGRLMSDIWPSLTLPNGIDAEWVSHLKEVTDGYKADPLGLSVVSARWFTEVLSAQEDLMKRANTLTQPFLFLLAGTDRLVDVKAAEEVFHKMGSDERELEIYPKLYHEILNEEPWADILRRMIRWTEKYREKAADAPGDAAGEKG